MATPETSITKGTEEQTALKQPMIERSAMASWLWDWWPAPTTIVIIALAALLTCLVKPTHAGYHTILWPRVDDLYKFAIALITGFWGLWQFNRVHKQREKQFNDQQANAQAHFDEQQRITREHFENQQKLTREHFDANARAAEFKEILDRFASPDLTTRASAALRLAGFGETLKPGAELGDPRTEANNPYFLQASQQLITALTIEKESVIRDAIRQGLQRMIDFAKVNAGTFDPEDPTAYRPDCQPLLYAMIKQLVTANIKAKEAFIRAMAEYSVSIHGDSSLNEKDLNLISTSAPFCSNPDITIDCLKYLMTYGDTALRDVTDVIRFYKVAGVYKATCLTFESIYSSSSPADVERPKSLSVRDVQLSGNQLINVRDALCYALRSLSDPGEIHFNGKQRQERLGQLDLNYAFLSGAVIHGAKLKGANLEHATLHGAKLGTANLQSANLEFAVLQDADLGNAILQDAVLGHSNLKGAYLFYANLIDANLGFASVQGAKLNGARLQAAKLFSTNFVGANLSSARLYGVYIRMESDDPNFPHPTLFPVDTLDKADLDPEHYYERTDVLDQRTEILRAHLSDKENLQRLIDEYEMREREKLEAERSKTSQDSSKETEQNAH